MSTVESRVSWDNLPWSKIDGKTFLFVRHGQSEGNVHTIAELLLTGKPNQKYELTQEGVKQGIKAGLLIKEFCEKQDQRISALFQSTYVRTQHTLECILRQLGQWAPPKLKVTTSKLLDEKIGGIFHTMTRNEIEKKHPIEIEKSCKEGYYLYKPPEGESCVDVEVRVHQFVKELLENSPPGVTLVSAHGRWIQILENSLWNRSPEEFNKRKKTDPFPNCAMLILTGNGCKEKEAVRYKLKKVNPFHFRLNA